MAVIRTRNSIVGNQAYGNSRQHNGDVYNIHGPSQSQHEETTSAFWDLRSQFARLWSSKAVEEEGRTTREILASLTYETIDARWEAIPEAATNTFEWLFSIPDDIMEYTLEMVKDGDWSFLGEYDSTVSQSTWLHSPFAGQSGPQTATLSTSSLSASSDYFESRTNHQELVADATLGNDEKPTSSMMRRKGPSFRSWLEESHEVDLFWISGAPGSGKSTLMKFISEREDVKTSLSIWASGRTLSQAYHFFWGSGTEYQRSYKGMLRSLLYQVCLQRPAATKAAFPDRWNGEQSGAWSLKQLWSTLERLTLDEESAFCFFIDGLDEYYPEDEHIEVAKQLLALARRPNVKVCVSSRPWQAFTLVFTAAPYCLKLEDLNSRDLMLFTEQKLEEARDTAGNRSPLRQSELKSVVRDIVDRSSGVFLWVHLVVVDLTERILVGSTMSQLTKCLEGLPPRLEDYFAAAIFNRIKSTYKHGETVIALRLALLLEDASKSAGGQWTGLMNDVATYWLALQTECLHSFDHLLLRDSLEIRSSFREALAFTCDLIEGCSGGLLTVHRGSDKSSFAMVEFTHRTMRDFLRTEDMLALLEKNTPKQMISNETVFKLIVARLWMMGPSTTDIENDEWGRGSLHRQWLIDTAIAVADDNCDNLLAKLWKSTALELPEGLLEAKETESSLADMLFCRLLKEQRYGAVKEIVRQQPALVVRRDLFERLLKSVWGPAEHDLLCFLLEYGMDARNFTRTWRRYLEQWQENSNTAVRQPGSSSSHVALHGNVDDTRQDLTATVGTRFEWLYPTSLQSESYLPQRKPYSPWDDKDDTNSLRGPDSDEVAVDRLWKTTELLVHHGAPRKSFHKATKRLAIEHPCFEQFHAETTDPNDMEAVHRKRQEIRKRLWPILRDRETRRILHVCWSPNDHIEVVVDSSQLRFLDDPYPHTLPKNLRCASVPFGHWQLSSTIVSKLRIWCTEHDMWEPYDRADTHDARDSNIQQNWAARNRSCKVRFVDYD